MLRTANVLDLYHGDNRDRMPDFTAIKALGVLGIIHKASQGIHTLDPQYTVRRKAAQDGGLLWGAYHFLDSSDAADQADFFLSHAGVSSGDPILLAADYEDEPRGNTAVLHQLMTFVQAVDQASPSQCVIYSSNRIRETLLPHPGGHMAANMIGHEDFFAKHRLWLAEYGPHLNVPWPWRKEDGSGAWLWQWKENGRVNPILGDVDLNFFDGTFEQLSNSWVS